MRWAAVGLALHLMVIGFDAVFSGQVRVFSSQAAEWFVHFGGKNTVLPLATEALGHRPFVRDNVGHDGQWFWILSHDPLLLHRAGQVRTVVDRPVYRAQRVGYPLLCAPWLLGGESSLLWGMLITNLIAVAVGGFLACLLLLDLDARPWIAIAFGLCPGVLFGTLLDLADGLALMWLLAVLVAVQKNRWGWAIAAAIAGALTKESMLLSFFAVAWLGRPTEGCVTRSSRWRLALVPLFAVAAWSVYVRYRLGWSHSSNEEITWPFWGYVKAARESWLPEGRWFQALAAIALLPLAIHILILWRRRPGDLLLTAALPVAIMIPLFTDDVIGVALNSTRGAGPAIFLWLLSMSPRRANV